MTNEIKKSAFVTRQYNEETVKHLIELGYSPLMAKILSSREIIKPEDMDNSLKNLIPITKLTNVLAMADIISDGIIAGKTFKVVADYDSDGATSCTVVMRAMRGFDAEIDYMVPNRFKHGYGLSRTIINEIVEEGNVPDYIITVDNGIASIDGVNAANEHGIKVLVTDHHLQGDELPAAECIVNPNQKACDFPSKNMAGCGVAWYVMMAVQRRLRDKGWFAERKEFQVGSLVDFVALGTVADVVKLDRNNRILVDAGLKMIRDGKSHAGIYALLRVAGKDFKKTHSMDFGFMLGPRINAAGRMDDISIGIEALCADSDEHAARLAAQLDDLNRERKDVEKGMQNTALLNIEMSDENIDDKFSIVMHHPDWHEGVIGILASRLKEKFYRPTIIFSDAEKNEHGEVEFIKGSCRSIPPLNIRNALDLVYKKRPDIISKFGGHAMAAGITIKGGTLEIFQEEFENAVREMLTAEDLSENVETDGSLTIDEMTVETAQMLEQVAWGQGFPPPTFYDKFKVVKQDSVKGHMRLLLEKEGKLFTAMKWKCTEPFPDYILAQYALSVNDFNGKKDIQLFMDRWETVSMKQELKVDNDPFNFDKENGMSF